MVKQKTMSCNQELVKIFDELYSLYMNLGEEFRAFAFFDIARLIETQYSKTPITCGSELLKWHGVGQSTVDIVNDFLSTGRCQRIEELRTALEALEEEEEEEDPDFDECVEEFWDNHLAKVKKLDSKTPLEWVRATNLVYDESEPYPKSALKKLGWFKYADKHFNKAQSVIESLAPATLHFLAIELEKMQAGVPDDHIDILCNSCSLALEEQEDCECDEVQTKEYYKTLGVKFKN